jgi:broad specificity phosphatase PhoE
VPPLTTASRESKSILLIRHGETPGNAERIVQTPETPLSRRGMGQAERLAERLARSGIARILSSDLARATMTAEYLRLATGVPLQLDPLLQERSFGAIRGTPYDRLTVDIFAPDYQPPEGESWEVFHARVDRAWALMRRVAAETEGHLVVVTHGLVCRSLAARHLILPEGQEAPERWTNTGLTIADGPAPWRVRLLNCSVHLDGDLADCVSDTGPA